MKSKKKEPHQILYYFYMKWMLGLRKAELRKNVHDNGEPCHCYSTVILDILKHIVAENIVREFREVNSPFNFGCN